MDMTCARCSGPPHSGSCMTAAREEHEADLAARTTPVREGTMGDLTVWQKPSPSMPDLFAAQRLEAVITEKAEIRSGTCWLCYRQASAWVRAVKYHLGDLQRAEVTTADYDGPIPGFCHFHLADGPQQLAQAVYQDRSEMAWGFRPERYSVDFTDGTQHIGVCISPPTPHVTDEHYCSTKDKVS